MASDYPQEETPKTPEKNEDQVIEIENKFQDFKIVVPSGSDDLGRLLRTLSEKCPCCGKLMQLRCREIETLVRGEVNTFSQDYKQCSACDYQEEADQKRRKQTYDKTALRKEDLDLGDQRRGKNGYSNKRRFEKADGVKSPNRTQKRYRRNS